MEQETKSFNELLLSKEKLVDFIKYCLNHPDERFWQAL